MLRDLSIHGRRHDDLAEQGRQKIEPVDSGQGDEWTCVGNDSCASHEEDGWQPRPSWLLAPTLQALRRDRAADARSTDRESAISRDRGSHRLYPQRSLPPGRAPGRPIPWRGGRTRPPGCRGRSAGRGVARSPPSWEPWSISFVLSILARTRPVGSPFVYSAGSSPHGRVTPRSKRVILTRHLLQICPDAILFWVFPITTQYPFRSNHCAQGFGSAELLQRLRNRALYFRRFWAGVVPFLDHLFDEIRYLLRPREPRAPYVILWRRLYARNHDIHSRMFRKMNLLA